MILAIASMFLAIVAGVGLWLLVCLLISALSGWRGLARRYPARDEEAIKTLRGVSGRMGMGVQLRGALTLQACPSGLRMSLPRIFAPLDRPVFVPWTEVRAEMVEGMFRRTAQLTFGSPPAGRLRIDARTWEDLASSAAGVAP